MQFGGLWGAYTMYLDYTPEQRQLQMDLREYFSDLMTSAVRNSLAEESVAGPTYRRVIRKLGSDGWLGIGWPTEFGGQGRSTIEQFIFFDETQRFRVPVPMISLNTVGPTLMEHGSAEQKAAYLPAILRGEIDFAIGYSEPEAGTDLAAMRTRADKVADGYVINGAKVYTSRGLTSDYVWLAARTQPNSRRHHGISIFIVDTAAVGYRATPIRTIAGYDTYATYYEDVEIPANALVGPEHDGWRLITTQLNHERVGMAAFGGLAFRLLDDALAWAERTRTESGAPLIEYPPVAHALSRAHALLEGMKLLNWRAAWAVGDGSLSPAQASAVKVYGSEAAIEVYRLLREAVGESSMLTSAAPKAPFEGDLEWAHRRAVINTFGGGTNEIQREIIARSGLGMPRVTR